MKTQDTTMIKQVFYQKCKNKKEDWKASSSHLDLAMPNG